MIGHSISFEALLRLVELPTGVILRAMRDKREELELLGTKVAADIRQYARSKLFSSFAFIAENKEEREEKDGRAEDRRSACEDKGDHSLE